VNTLIVKLDPSPKDFSYVMKNSVSYGWHYVHLVTSGIWRPVRLEARGGAALDAPFLSVKSIDGEAITTRLRADVIGASASPGDYLLRARLTPRNFSGNSFEMSRSVAVSPGHNEISLEGVLEGARLWWPVGMGEPNLYTLECELSDGAKVVDRYVCNWGAKKVDMELTDGEVASGSYKWQFVINGRRAWIKGANWCYPDCLLRLDRNRQRRFVELARNANIQILRVWGGGPIQNDEFYDLCDEMGVMVQQEFAVMGSDQTYRVTEAEATDVASLEVRRLRNRPSLAMWCGSNEADPLGPIFRYLGRVCYEMDGTRPYHRTSPMGGDWHWYSVGPGQEPLLDYRTFCIGKVAIGEAGLPSPPDIETSKLVLPAEELAKWPIEQNSVFVHHTWTFDPRNVDIMMRYVKEWLEPTDLATYTRAAHLAHGLGLKFLIETMRSQKPRTTTAYIYKLTENYPAASWATIDAYGYPKIAHYYVGQANVPVHVMSTFPAWDSSDEKIQLPIVAVNDTDSAVAGTIKAELYDGDLNLIDSDSYQVTVPIEAALEVASKTYSVDASRPRPLFLLLKLIGANGEIDRNFYHFDFTQTKGSLFSRPRTRLDVRLEKSGDSWALAVTNAGAVPAVSVEFDFGAAGNTFYVQDSGLWLDPGETKKIAVRRTPAVDGRTFASGRCGVSAWNAEKVDVAIK